MAKILIDTNLIIRFLVNDDPKKAAKVKRVLLETKNTNVLLDTVVAEIVWVLSSYYEQDKSSILEKIRALIHVDTISCNKSLLDRSLTIWGNNNLSFIDSYIAASVELEDLKIYSYDRQFDNIKTITRLEP